MAKATIAFTQTGNDGYSFAMREDGQWFLKQGFYSQRFGWTTTKWSPVSADEVIIQECLAAHSRGETVAFVGFGRQMIIRSGKGLRLPEVEYVPLR